MSLSSLSSTLVSSSISVIRYTVTLTIRSDMLCYFLLLDFAARTKTSGKLKGAPKDSNLAIDILISSAMEVLCRSVIISIVWRR